MTTQIFSVREHLFGEDDEESSNVDLREDLESNINMYIQKIEFEILHSCDYNLNTGTGYDLI